MDLGLTLSWFRTRRPVVFLLFMIFATIAGLFLIEGYLSNPYLPKPYESTFVPKWKVGKEEFELPNFIHAGPPNTVTVWCNLTSVDFVVGNPSAIVVQVTIETTLYEIILVHVEPRNTIRYLLPVPPWDYPNVPPETSFGFSTEMSLRMVENSTFYQTWTDGEWVEFQAVGPLELTITITLLPRDIFYIDTDTWNAFNSQFPDSRFTKNVVLEPILIQSGETVQQRISENLNLSLSYFVLFFASANIAVAIYDHSGDSDRLSDYEKKKAEKKSRKNTEPIEYVI